MTVLVVAHPFDAVALGVVDRLRSWSITPVVATPSQLCGGVVTYRNDEDGARWAVDLGGRILRSGEITGVLNRARYLEPAGFADPDDEVYAACERGALYAALMESVDGAVLNRTTGASLSGPVLSDVEWLATASRHGLPVLACRLSTSGTWVEPARRPLGTFVVIDGVAHGAPDSDLELRCAGLAAALRCELLQVRLVETTDGRSAVGAVEPFPAHVEPGTLGLLAARLAAGERAEEVA